MFIYYSLEITSWVACDMITALQNGLLIPGNL